MKMYDLKYVSTHLCKRHSYVIFKLVNPTISTTVPAMIYTIHEDSFILDDKLFNLTVDFPGNLRHIAFLEVSYFDALKPKRDPYSKHQIHLYMGVSKNRGTPKSWILIGFSIIYHPFWGTPIFGNTHIYIYIFN